MSKQLSKQDRLQKAVEAVEAFIKAGRKVPRLFGRELVEQEPGEENRHPPSLTSHGDR